MFSTCFFKGLIISNPLSISHQPPPFPNLSNISCLPLISYPLTLSVKKCDQLKSVNCGIVYLLLWNCFKKWRLTTAIFLPSPEERSAAITTTLPNAAVNNCPRCTELSRQKVNCKSNYTIKYHTTKKVRRDNNNHLL